MVDAFQPHRPRQIARQMARAQLRDSLANLFYVSRFAFFIVGAGFGCARRGALGQFEERQQRRDAAELERATAKLQEMCID